MYKAIPFFTFLIFAALGILCTTVALAQEAESFRQKRTLDGELNGAAYAIRVPARWNGTLIVYAHGYRVTGSFLGQPEDRRAFAAPSPREGFPQLPEMEELLLAHGYALAGSAFRENGWAVREGSEDSAALVRLFQRQVGRPKRTVILGLSMGALVALEGAEKRAHLYDGAICACGPVAGATRTFDAALDFAVAYHAAFGWPAAWGTVNKVRADIRFETDVLPVLLGQLQNPANFGRFEFIRLVTQTPLAGFYDGTKPLPWLLINMLFATQGRAELEQRAHGTVAQNLDHHYRLTEAESAYLASLGVHSAAWLQTMNGELRGFAADAWARRYAERNYTLAGRLRAPVLSLHTTGDGLALTAAERVLRRTVQATRQPFLLAQAYTNDAGHCSFTPQQLLTAVQAMERWLKTRQRPDAEDFPTSLGFVSDFVPPAWPQPITLPRFWPFLTFPHGVGTPFKGME